MPLCRLSANRSAKAAEQISQRNGFSPECTFAWFFKCAACENAEPHISHLYGFSPVCMRRWFHNVAWRAKPLSQTSHTYGRSPLCVRSWFLRCGDCENCMPHVWHLLKKIRVSKLFLYIKVYKLYILVRLLAGVYPCVVFQVHRLCKG